MCVAKKAMYLQMVHVQTVTMVRWQQAQHVKTATIIQRLLQVAEIKRVIQATPRDDKVEIS